MIFSEKAREILKSWALDFEHSGVVGHPLKNILEFAAGGGEIKTTYASAIASQCYSNISAADDENVWMDKTAQRLGADWMD